jgi:hypothetical protein
VIAARIFVIESPFRLSSVDGQDSCDWQYSSFGPSAVFGVTTPLRPGKPGGRGSTDLLTYRFGSIENPFVILRRSLSVAVIATPWSGPGVALNALEAYVTGRGRATRVGLDGHE